MSSPSDADARHQPDHGTDRRPACWPAATTGQTATARQITVWSLEDVADRVTATKAIIADFTAKTGIKVDLVTVNEDQFPSLIASSAAAGDLPDVVGSVSLAGVRTLAAQRAARTPTPTAEIVDRLGRQTFSPRALELTADGGKQLAVPSDGWGQLLVYRKDLFAAAGLPAPDTYEKIAAAAAKLNTGGVAGITAATAPGDVFTQQTFEHLALANNCQLTDDSGKVTLDSPRVRRGVPLLRRPDPHQLGQGRAGRRHHPGHLLRRQGGHADLVAVHPRRAGRAARRRPPDLPAVPGRPGASWRRTAASSPRSRARTAPSRPSTARSAPGRCSTARPPTRRSRSWSTCSATATRAGSACPPRGASRCARAPRRTGEVPAPPGTPARPAWTPRSRWPRCTATTCSPRCARSPDTFRRWGLTQGQGKLVGAILGRAAGAQGARRRDRRQVRRRGRRRTRQEGRRGDQGRASIDHHRAGAPAAPRTGSGRRRPGRRPLTLRRRESRAGLALVAPTLLVVIAVIGIPIVWTVVLAFQRVRLATLRKTGLFGEFTLDNIDRVLHTPGFADTLWTTLLYSVGGTVGSIVVGLVAALVVRRPFRGRTLVRASMLLPYVAPVVAVTFVWQVMLDPQLGIVNDWGRRLLGWDAPVPFLSQESTAPGHGDRVRGVALLPVRVPVPAGPAPGGARRVGGGRPGRRGHPHPAVPAHPAAPAAAGDRPARACCASS